MRIVELNDTLLLDETQVDGYMLGVEKLSTECFKEYSIIDVKKIIGRIHELKRLAVIDATSLFFDEDLEYVENAIKELSSADYFMYEDLGIMDLIPFEKRFYYSSTYATNSKDIELILSENKYCLLSPVVQIEDAKKIIDKYNDNLFLISFGTWKIFYSRRNLLSTYFDYRNLTYNQATYKMIEETRTEEYPIIERNGTKIYLHDYFYLENDELNATNSIIKTFDLELDASKAIIEGFVKGSIEPVIEKLNLKSHKGLLYENSILIKGGTR